MGNEGFDWDLLLAIVALAVAGFNVWLLVRVLGFMQTVENLLFDIERSSAKTAEAVKKLAE
jgi:hypothetical protein